MSCFNSSLIRLPIQTPSVVTRSRDNSGICQTLEQITNKVSLKVNLSLAYLSTTFEIEWSSGGGVNGEFK
jgi:hypothetical protein